MKKDRIPVALEGLPFIAYSAFITLFLAISHFFYLSLLFLFLTAFILYFFRDPERIGPEDKAAILSPADGVILKIEEFAEAECPIPCPCKKISIFMNVFNVHVNRAPYTGEVKKVLYTPGSFYSADSDKSEQYNEHCTTVIETEEGTDIAFVQIAGLIARRIVNRLEPGDRIARGQRFGLIRFGSRVDVYLPQETDVAIAKGQKVRAGETQIGHLNPDRNQTTPISPGNS